MNSIFRKRLSFVLKLLVSGGFVLWLVWRINWGEVARRISEVDRPYLLLYVAVLLAGIAISSRKWQVIARAKGFHRSYRDFFRAYLTGTFINNFLPSTIGGDTYRTLWLGKRDGRLSPALSTALFDRFTGIWAAMVFAILFSLFHVKLVFANPFWLFLDIAIIASLSFDFALPILRKSSTARQLLEKFPERIRRLVHEVMRYPFHRTTVPVLGWALLFNLIGVGLANLVLFRALGGEVHTIEYLGVIFLVTIVSNIPISINNIGVKEWAYATFFGYLGTSVEAAVAVAVTSRLIQMMVSFSAIPFYLRSRDILGRETEDTPDISSPSRR